MKAIHIFQILIISAVLPMAAGATEKDSNWTGTLRTVVHGAKNITVADAFETRTFRISTNCAILTANNKAGTVSDLQPGEQVVIRYRRVDGELVADSIAEKVLRCSGTVTGIVPMEGCVTLELNPVLGLGGTVRAFRSDGSCQVLLSNGQSGTLENVKPGDKVTILYKPTNGGAIACQVVKM